MSRASACFLVLVSTSLVACVAADDSSDGADQAEDVATVDAALDSVEVVTAEAEMLTVVASGTASATTPAEAAMLAAAQAADAFEDSACLVSSQVGSTVTYTFSDCSGQHGLVHVSGTVDVTYGVTIKGVSLDVVSDDMTVNGVAFDLTASAVYVLGQDMQRLVVETSGTGTASHGRSATREGEYTFDWSADDACIALQGSWSHAGTERSGETSVTDFATCEGSCPAAGGTIVYQGGPSDASVTIAYDGSDAAGWSTSGGKSGTLPLACGN